VIYLVEHFYSIQGEGKYLGRPSLFLRFGACNMKCEGFACVEKAEDGSEVLGCDTVYAVNKEHFSHNWQSIVKTSQLLDILKEYELPKKPVDIILTGGEPLLYANDAILVAFLEEVVQRGHRVCFETNGSLNVDFESFPIYKECVFALSVKLENSGEALKKRVNAKILENLTENAKEAFFKFSISHGSCEVEQEIEDIVSLVREDIEVFCMPLGATKKEIEKNSEPLVEFCKRKGYNFSDRLHIRIWNKEKGV
jgi:7-carboxy-7-deazaguanine synthase